QGCETRYGVRATGLRRIYEIAGHDTWKRSATCVHYVVDSEIGRDARLAVLGRGEEEQLQSPALRVDDLHRRECVLVRQLERLHAGATLDPDQHFFTARPGEPVVELDVRAAGTTVAGVEAGMCDAGQVRTRVDRHARSGADSGAILAG